jgi:hypothetical protein
VSDRSRPPRRYDEDDDYDVRRRPRRDDYDDEDDHAEPRRPRRKPKRRGRGGVPTVVIVLLCLLPVLGGGGFLVYWLVNRDAGKSDKPSERLIGKWEYEPPEIRGGRIIVEFKNKKDMNITGIVPGKTVSGDENWEVLKEKKDEVTIRHHRTDGGGKTNEWRIELLNNDKEIRVHFLTSGAPSIIYKRVR